MKASLVIVTLALVGALVTHWGRAEITRARALPAGLRVLALPPGDALSPWISRGFVRLEPPIALPGDAADALHAEVWVRIPEGAAIDVVDGRWVWPVGSELDRIEWLASPHGRRIADVRGTEITRDGERFHAYRPRDRAANELVQGFYLRGDEAGQRAMADAFVALADEGGLFSAGDRGSVPALRHAALTRLTRLLDCAGCHEHSLGEAENDARWLRRATDASGFYVPLYVMRDDAPMERYRPVDRSAQSPFVSLRCGDRLMPITGTTDTQCGDGSVPRLTFDLGAALEANDPHGLAVCASRRWLSDHMTSRARAFHRASLDACGVPR